jgi:hypothetical protein
MRGVLRFFRVLACTWVVVCCGMVATAFSLPAERHYEMVSPAFKGGYSASRIEGVASDGNSVVFRSEGSFAKAPSGFNLTGLDYLARRDALEWSTTPLMAPAPLIAEPQAGDMSPSLDEVIEIGRPGPHSYHPFREEDFLLHPTDMPDIGTAWEVGGIVRPLPKEGEEEGEFRIAYKSASLGFCHVLLTDSETEPLVPEAIGASIQLYELDRGCGSGSQSLALVGKDNKDSLINPMCHTTIGNEAYAHGEPDAFNAINDNGEEVLFTVCVTGSETGPESPHQLFMRLAGSRTIEISKPLLPACEEVPCAGADNRAVADFVGASEDGSKVYFTAPLDTGQPPLVPGDTDASNNLYMATIGCPVDKPACTAVEREVTSLAQVSHDPAADQAADVMGVVRVAPDGTRAYFVAGGDLLSTSQQEALKNEERPAPRVGAANLYVYDGSSGAVAFIGDLCSGPQLSGAVEDIQCPATTSARGFDARLWTNEEGEAQTAGADGRFLVFATYAQLLGGDTNRAKDLYRYDAETGRLDRISSGENGYDDNGNSTILNENGEALGASIAPGYYGGGVREQHEIRNRAISEDGSRIVFTSAEPLSPGASNGLENAYEWSEGGGEEGDVSLISSGDAETPVGEVTISTTGSDLFFVTTQGLVPQDIDGVDDVYDARIGSAFPTTVAPVQPCSGDACQGPLTNPAPLLIPGSVSQAPGDNFPPPVTSKAKPKSKAVQCKKGYVRKKGRCVKSKPANKTKKSNHRGSK